MKIATRSTAGNVLIYVLIAVALFAALSFAVSRGMGGPASAQLDSDRANLRAGELINYATTARSAVEQMRTMSNILPEAFNFVKPGDAAYDTGANSPKVYHPAGGGLTIYNPAPELFESSSAQRGWVVQQGTNVQWSPTPASDIIFTFLDVNPAVCKAINQRLYKDSSVPVTTAASNVVFINGGGDDADFTSTMCATCNGKPSYCVQDSEGHYAFYNVLLAR